MLFVFIVCFAMGDVCYVHHCDDKDIGSITVRKQTVKDKLIHQMRFLSYCQNNNKKGFSLI